MLFNKLRLTIRNRTNDLWDAVNDLFGDIFKLMKRTDAVESLLIRQGEELERLRKDHDFVGSRVDNISKGVIKAHESSGGYWKTASGQVMRIRDMSTDHIKNCIHGGFAKTAYRAMERELRRRKNEDFWRRQLMPGETIRNAAQGVYAKPEDNPLDRDGNQFVGWAYDTPIYVDKHTPSKNVQAIKDLFQRRPW